MLGPNGQSAADREAQGMRQVKHLLQSKGSAIFAIAQWFPYRVEDLIFNQIIHILTQLKIRGAVRRLIVDHHIDVVQDHPAGICLAFTHVRFHAVEFFHRAGHIA